MSKTIKNLLKNSGLPGPRGNLELLHTFAENAAESEIDECLSYYTDSLKNSPEEFVVMCGVVALCIHNKDDIKGTLSTIRGYASHGSWRIRESVAIGIQEIAENQMRVIIDNLWKWMDGNDLEKRAIIAALCEPKLLIDPAEIIEVLEMLARITIEFEPITGRLSDNQTSLRKTLGYGWSVAIVSLPKEGKIAFEKIARSDNRHIQWIVIENLKKKRLSIMDKKWVDKLLATFD
jgi:hypothetical protein